MQFVEEVVPFWEDELDVAELELIMRKCQEKNLISPSSAKSILEKFKVGHENTYYTFLELPSEMESTGNSGFNIFCEVLHESYIKADSKSIYKLYTATKAQVDKYAATRKVSPTYQGCFPHRHFYQFTFSMCFSLVDV